MINRTPVGSVTELRAILRKMKSGDPVAVQIERQGRLRYIAFELP
jgi:S1-C subfamily serine protease